MTMRKTKSAFGLATSLVQDFRQQMGELAQKVKDRFDVVKKEMVRLQQEMETLSEDYERLTGKALAERSNGRHASPRQASAAKSSDRKRTRNPSPTVEWLQEKLGKGGMTVKQLQEAAAEDNLSGLRIPALLKENKTK